MSLRCPRCYSGDFYITGRCSDSYHCRECGYTGEFMLDLDDDSAVTKLREHKKLAPVPYDTTDFSRWGVIGLTLLVVLFLFLLWILLGPHP